MDNVNSADYRKETLTPNEKAVPVPKKHGAASKKGNNQKRRKVDGAGQGLANKSAGGRGI